VTEVLYIEDNDDNVYMLKMRLELLRPATRWGKHPRMGGAPCRVTNIRPGGYGAPVSS
jgi:hypothetical protein